VVGRERIVLIVEDDPALRSLIGEVLIESSADGLGRLRVLTAPDGTTALAHLDGVVPDLVLLDLVLPRMDGFDLCRRIKSDPRLAATRVVALSALPMHDDGQRIRDAGCDALVAKPFDVDDLVRVVADWLPPAHEGTPPLAGGAPAATDARAHALRARASAFLLASRRGLVRPHRAVAAARLARDRSRRPRRASAG
jgi:CheY-like chemotaxis protein